MYLVIQRIEIAAAVVVLYIALVKLYKYFNRRRLQLDHKKFPLPAGINPGLPTLLYFWTPNCAQCKSQEKHLEKATDELQKMGKKVNMKKINAHKEQKLASLLRVVTVPTTVIVDSNGNIAAWNPGLAQADIIVNQFSNFPDE